uniref:Uncharacterized protein n=1 Tax=Glossina austeni TaxID=7395 RepID=A0A1A9UPV6_GLOAU
MRENYFNLNKDFTVNYLTNKSFNVEQSEASQLSLESSSFVLLNQFNVERTAFVACCWVPLLLDGPDVEFLRRKPSIAEPRAVASTIASFVCSVQLFCLLRGFNFGLLSRNTSLDCKRSIISLERAIAVLLLRTLFFRAIGSCRLANQSDHAAELFSCASLTICFALFNIDTSKLFERVERPTLGSSKFELLLDAAWLALRFVLVFVDEITEPCASSYLLISIADDVSVLKIELISGRLPKFHPVFFLSLTEERLLCDCMMLGEIMAGCSEALRMFGDIIGCGPTHSEKRRFV